MSHAGNIVDISELEIERVDRSKGIEVWAKPSSRPRCLYGNCGKLHIKATHKRTVKHTRQGNQVMTLHLSVPKYHRLNCHRYFRHRFKGIKPRLHEHGHSTRG